MKQHTDRKIQSCINECPQILSDVCPGVKLLHNDKVENSSPSVFSEVTAQSLVFCVVFCRSLFVLLLLVITLSVLRFTASGIWCLPTFLK